MTEGEGVFYSTEPYKPNGANRPPQARATDYASKEKDDVTAAAQFKTVAAFCREYQPISYIVEPFLRSSSVYALTAATGAGKTGLLVIIALAIATGKGDSILGREVTTGRVAYICAENPDDCRMRIMAAAYLLKIDLDKIDKTIVILERREKPEEIEGQLKALSRDGGFSLVMVDTLQAAFDGDDLNNNVQSGEFMRRLRRLTQIDGKPTVIIAAHPVKNASDDNLIPYGGGAALNEVDGNLTLVNSAGVVTLHWKGKLRGVDFKPVLFRIELITSPYVKDTKGRGVQLPVLRPCSMEDAEQRQTASVDVDVAILKAMYAKPGDSIRDLATAINIHRSRLERRLKKLASAKSGELVKNTLGKWTLTKAGMAAIEGR